MQWTHETFLLTDDPARLDLDAVHGLLATSYWAQGRSRELLRTAFQNSLCLNLWSGVRQIGFCRAVTDYATFTWLCDVIVAEAFRGQGLGKWMVRCLIEHPKLQTCNQALATRDAHSLYERCGFERVEFMKRKLKG